MIKKKKDPSKSPLRKGSCWLKFQGTVIILGKALQQKCGAAGHPAAAVRMWRERNAGAQQLLLFYEVQDPSPWFGAADC